MMHRVPHPGEFIREICLEPLNLTVTEAARKLGVTRKALSELLNGKTGISTEMALRLAKAFNTTPESWLTQQMNYNLCEARQKKDSLRVEPIWNGRKSHRTNHHL